MSEKIEKLKKVKVSKPKKKKSKKKIIVIVLLVIALAIFVITKLGGNTNTETTEEVYSYDTAQSRTVGIDLSNKGTLESKDAYTVTTLVSGNIIWADFEEGQKVEKDDVLYKIDSSDADNSLEKLNNSLQDAEKNYNKALKSLNDLKIKVKDVGIVTELNVKVGDEISAGTVVASVRNSKLMLIKLPFSSNEVENFSIGDEAKILVEGTYEVLTGVVTSIKNVQEVLSGNRLVKYVELQVENPGAITKGSIATASVGGIDCSQNGTFDYKSNYEIVAKGSGIVEGIYCKEGDAVNNNDLIAVLSSETVNENIESCKNAIDDCKLSIDSQEEILKNYVIKSPIAGTVIEKNYKLDDTTNTGGKLCTIFDMTYLKTIMAIDENDIAKVKVGQKVSIEATALAGEKFQGIVTKVNIKGNTNNSVTTYPVSVRIDEAGDLLPGMNVTASIELDKAENVVSIPVAAVSRGDYVLVKDSDSTHNEAEMDSPLKGYVYKKVVVGLNDESYVEIKSGLLLSDEIAYIADSPSTEQNPMYEDDMDFGGY